MLIKNLSDITEISEYSEKLYAYEPTYADLESYYDYHDKTFNYGLIE